jgi:Beta-galactosidase
MKKTRILSLLLVLMALVTKNVHSQEITFGESVTWDRHSLIIGGRRVCPVMGEVHYSRIPANEWRQEVQKMKAGGVTIIACYVFWNHIEEMENQFDWSGQRNLRTFLTICKEESMPVVLRMGPFCHGEVRNGGFPDWVVKSGCRLRSEDPYSSATWNISIGKSSRKYKVSNGKTADPSSPRSSITSIVDEART